MQRKSYPANQYEILCNSRHETNTKPLDTKLNSKTFSNKILPSKNITSVFKTLLIRSFLVALCFLV